MSSLGSCDVGDSVRLTTTVTNISSIVADVDSIMITVVDSNDVVKINTTSANISKYDTGKYMYDLYLDNRTFSEGCHYVIWSGSNLISGKNFSFYDESTLYVEDNRLL